MDNMDVISCGQFSTATGVLLGIRVMSEASYPPALNHSLDFGYYVRADDSFGCGSYVRAEDEDSTSNEQSTAVVEILTDF